MVLVAVVLAAQETTVAQGAMEVRAVLEALEDLEAMEAPEDLVHRDEQMPHPDTSPTSTSKTSQVRTVKV